MYFANGNPSVRNGPPRHPSVVKQPLNVSATLLMNLAMPAIGLLTFDWPDVNQKGKGPKGKQPTNPSFKTFTFTCNYTPFAWGRLSQLAATGRQADALVKVTNGQMPVAQVTMGNTLIMSFVVSGKIIECTMSYLVASTLLYNGFIAVPTSNGQARSP
jgi:hypothetical protein